MKINFVIPVPGNTGGLQVIYKYAEEFQKAGHEVTVYFPLRIYLLNRKRSKFWQCYFIVSRTALNIYRYCLHHKELEYNNKVRTKHVPVINDKYMPKADAVIATAWPTSFDVSKLSPEKGEKYYFVQDYEVWDDERLGNESYKLPLKHIVIAKWIQELLDERFGLMNLPIVNNGIDLEKYSNEGKVINYTEPLKFLMLYHKLPKKGIKEGLEVFEKIKEKNPGVTLTMFGVKKVTDIPEYVNFIENPSVEQIRQLYSNADIYIFPSLVEGWGLTVIEAMAATCAVAGTRTGCLLDIGKHYENAMISEPGDVDEMVANIQRMIDDRALLEKISLNGRQAIQSLSWEKSAEKFIKILRES